MATKVVAASDPGWLIIGKDGKLFLRTGVKPDEPLIYEDADLYIDAAIAKRGFYPVHDSPDIGDGMPELKFGTQDGDPCFHVVK